MSTNYPSVGTELKVNINCEPVCGYKMVDYDFVCKFYTLSGGDFIEVKKEDMIYVDDDNYIALVDTALTGSGQLIARLTAYIPDSVFPDGLRTEIAVIDTGITIKR